MMVVGLVLPHAPFVATPEDYALYDDRVTLDALPGTPPEALHPALRDLQRRAKLEDAEPVPLEAQRRARVAYYGMCTQVDRGVGRILDALEEAGLSGETIVVYTSDHGEQLGEHGMWWKHTFYQGSVGIPLLMAGPGLPQGTISANVSLLDLGPTLLDVAGAPAIPGATGRSFRCLLEGHGENWPDTAIAENLWPPESTTLQRMLKRGPWKLCHYPGEAPQLFNLEDDPGECHDLADDPACRKTLEALMEALLANWDYDAITARRANSAVVEGWTRQWWKQCDLPEPDAPWWNEPPLNRLDLDPL
jgi:choline-sulfatase